MDCDGLRKCSCSEFFWAQLQKAKRQVRLHNRALDHVWGTFDNCLGAFLDRLWFSSPSISRKREKRGANHCLLFRIKGTLGFFLGVLGKEREGERVFLLDPPFNLFLSFSLFCFGPSYPPLFLKKKEEGKRERKKTREERFFYLMPFSDKKVCIAKHLFVCNQISKKAQSQCKKYFTKEKGCFLWNFSGHCGKFFFSPRSKRRKAFWLPKTFLAEIRGEEEKKKRLELYSFF